VSAAQPGIPPDPAHALRPLSIVLVVNDMGYGGAEMQVAELARRFARRGHRVSLVTLVRFLDFEESLRDAGVATHSLGMAHGRPSLRGILALAAIVHAARADVVHAHLLGACVVTRLSRLLAPHVRVVCTGHSSYERSWVRYAALRATDPLCDVWTNVSTLGVATFVKHHAVPASKARHTPNGIDTEAYSPLDPRAKSAARSRLGMEGDRFIWLAVGSFRNEDKDYDVLLGAVALLVARGAPAFELWICGTGTLLEQKRDRAIAVGLQRHVRFLGLRADVPDLMRAADAYVLTSRTEAFPVVLLEACASALPVVCTSVGDAPAIVLDGCSGHVVPPHDVNAVAGAMDAVLRATPTERTAMGNAGRAHVASRFELDRTVDRWLALYRGERSR
jgi:glycosyltransferase involved in cell wall biosynthesis